MTPLRTHGFLSDEARAARSAVRGTNASWFNFCDALNDAGERLNGPPRDPSKAAELVADTLAPASFSMLLGLDAAGLKMTGLDGDLEKLRKQYHELLPAPPQQGEAHE